MTTKTATQTHGILGDLAIAINHLENAREALEQGHRSASLLSIKVALSRSELAHRKIHRQWVAIAAAQEPTT